MGTWSTHGAGLSAPQLAPEKAAVLSRAAIPERAYIGDRLSAKKGLLGPVSRCWALLRKGAVAVEKGLGPFSDVPAYSPPTFHPSKALSLTDSHSCSRLTDWSFQEGPVKTGKD